MPCSVRYTSDHTLEQALANVDAMQKALRDAHPQLSTCSCSAAGAAIMRPLHKASRQVAGTPFTENSLGRSPASPFPILILLHLQYGLYLILAR